MKIGITIIAILATSALSTTTTATPAVHDTMASLLTDAKSQMDVLDTKANSLTRDIGSALNKVTAVSKILNGDFTAGIGSVFGFSLYNSDIKFVQHDASLESLKNYVNESETLLTTGKGLGEMLISGSQKGKQLLNGITGLV